MYRNLEAELARNKITRAKVAEALNTNPGTVSTKLTKPNRLKMYEAMKIRDTFFPEFTIDYLFAL